VDVEPVSVEFAAQGRLVCMVDRNGEVHVWEIETPAADLNSKIAEGAPSRLDE